MYVMFSSPMVSNQQLQQEGLDAPGALRDL